MCSVPGIVAGAVYGGPETEPGEPARSRMTEIYKSATGLGGTMFGRGAMA